MDRDALLACASVAGILGGALLLLGGLAMALMSPFAAGMTWMMGTPLGAGTGWLVPLGAWGLAMGAAVLGGALGVYAHPRLAGAVMVAGGALSFPAMGGFMLGGLASIAAGACALAAARSPGDADRGTRGESPRRPPAERGMRGSAR